MNKKKARYIDKIAKQVDKKQEKILLNTFANKIRKKIKNKTIKN